MHSKLRLALYSDQQSPENPAMDDRLLRLIGVPHPRIGYLPSGPDPDRVWFNRKADYYGRLGAELAVFLDPASERIPEMTARLLECDAIHLSGGNTFSFLRWLKARDLLPLLRRYAQEGGTLIGESAGAILMTPDVDSAVLCGDDPDPSLAGTSALGLVDFRFWPHCPADTALTPAQRDSIMKYPELYACADGSGIIIAGGSSEAFGQVRKLGHA